jgi:protein-L-isoaspartate(D-aspartate) O-methyltransferase
MVYMVEQDFRMAKLNMLRRHLRARGIADPRVLQAMGKVPRELFVPAELTADTYADCALSIGKGQTISQPYMVALMTEALELNGDETVLEIGTGSGYQTAILAELARRVISIERLEPLADRARQTLDQLGYRNVAVLVGDGTLGWSATAPYSRILVTAMATECPPALFNQLAEGGILVIPLGGRESQVLQAIRKIEGQPRSTALVGCRFVPLIGEQGWPE